MPEHVLLQQASSKIRGVQVVQTTSACGKRQIGEGQAEQWQQGRNKQQQNQAGVRDQSGTHGGHGANLWHPPLQSLAPTVIKSILLQLLKLAARGKLPQLEKSNKYTCFKCPIQKYLGL